MLEKGLTSTQFADTVDVPRAVISHIIGGRNKPSLEVVTKIALAFPEISLNWILLGEGDMLKTLAVTNDSEEASIKSKVEAKNDNVPIDDQSVYKDKVQKFNAPFPLADPSQSDEKEIEQIVIFYRDKTFTAYRP